MIGFDEQPKGVNPLARKRSPANTSRHGDPQGQILAKNVENAPKVKRTAANASGASQKPKKKRYPLAKGSADFLSLKKLASGESGKSSASGIGVKSSARPVRLTKANPTGAS